MAKRIRPEPFTEGSLADLYRHFFGRLIQYKHPDLTIKEWMEQLFDVSCRDITRYEAHKAFEMPGHYYATPYTKIQGVGYRAVKPGTVLWVRKDARHPDCVDVEMLAGQGQKDCTYALTENQWDWVRLHVSVVEKKKK